MRLLTVFSSCIALTLCVVRHAQAQECDAASGPNGSRLCVTLRLADGKLKIATATLAASPTFMQRWRGTLDQARSDVSDGLDVLFRQFLPLYAYGLQNPEDESSLKDGQSAELRIFSKTWAEFRSAYDEWQKLDPA